MEIILAILSIVLIVSLNNDTRNKEAKYHEEQVIRRYQSQVQSCDTEKDMVHDEYYRVVPRPLSYDTTLRFVGKALATGDVEICTISNARERVKYLCEQIKLGHIRVPVFAKCEISQLYADFVVLAENSTDRTLAQEMETLSKTIYDVMFGFKSINVGHAIELLEQANDLLDRAEAQNNNQS